MQSPKKEHLSAARPRPQRKPQGRRGRAAASARAAAGAAPANKTRSRPGQLAVAELQARAGSQWALLAAQDAQAYAVEEERRKEVDHHEQSVLLLPDCHVQALTCELRKTSIPPDRDAARSMFSTGCHINVDAQNLRSGSILCLIS